MTVRNNVVESAAVPTGDFICQVEEKKGEPEFRQIPDQAKTKTNTWSDDDKYKELIRQRESQIPDQTKTKN